MEAFIEQMRQGLATAAATDPSKLAPDQLAEAAIDLLTRAVEHEIGQPIDPAGLRITYGPPSEPITKEQFAEAEAKEAAFYQHRFADYGVAQSLWVHAR